MPATSCFLFKPKLLAAAIEHLERALIQRALALCDGRLEDAATLLGLSRNGLYLKRQRFGIE